MGRAAIQLGAAWVRVAAAEPEPHVVAELPVTRRVAVGDVLRALFADPPDEVVLVHPAGVVVDGPAGALAVPAAVAVAGTGDAVVLDVGAAGAEAALVRAGRVVAVRRAAVGGRWLDEATLALLRELAGTGAARGGAPGEAGTAEARRVREALSLLPSATARLSGGCVHLGAEELRRALAGPLGAAVDVVRAVVAASGSGEPVLLVGGVARTPLLAELLDAADVGPVEIAARPDAAAVLGALRLPPGLPGRVPVPAPPVPPPGPTGESWLPPVPGPRAGWRIAAGLTGAAAAAALLGAGQALTAAPAAPVEVPPGLLVQYGYAVRVPPGWEHSGGLPEQRRSLLTPVAAPEGSDQISVERTPLGYDSSAEPERARTELRAEFDAAVAAGAPLSGFDGGARFADRPVVGYRQAGADGRTAVDWYVVLDGDAQLSVGCRYTTGGADAVRATCEEVVASLRRVP